MSLNAKNQAISNNFPTDGAQWEKLLKKARNFNWWTYNSMKVKVGGLKMNVIWDLYIPKTIRCMEICF